MGKRREERHWEQKKKRETEEESCGWEVRKRKNFIYHQSLSTTLV